MTAIEPRSVGICHQCGQVIVDGRADSGATEYDPMTLDGDFGCDDSPDTGEDGVGSHELAELSPPADSKGKGASPDDWHPVTETFKVLV